MMGIVRAVTIGGVPPGGRCLVTRLPLIDGITDPLQPGKEEDTEDHPCAGIHDQVAEHFIPRCLGSV
jgi:hypothetical protein